jgi:hypothetical protein
MLGFSATEASQITLEARETWALVNGFGPNLQRGKNPAD